MRTPSKAPCCSARPCAGEVSGEEETLLLLHADMVRLKAWRLQGQLHFSGAKIQQCGGGKGKLGKREARECFPSGGSRTFF